MTMTQSIRHRIRRWLGIEQAFARIECIEAVVDQRLAAIDDRLPELAKRAVEGLDLDKVADKASEKISVDDIVDEVLDRFNMYELAERVEQLIDIGYLSDAVQSRIDVESIVLGELAEKLRAAAKSIDGR